MEREIELNKMRFNSSKKKESEQIIKYVRITYFQKMILQLIFQETTM